MKILLVSFSPKRRGACAAALKYAESELIALGARTKILNITQGAGVCLGCYRCKTDGGCISEAVNMLSGECRMHDAFIFATPTHFGLASSTAYSMLSRVIISAKDSLINKPAFSLATARRAGGFGAVSDIDRLLSFAGVPIAGGCYPTVLYGSSEEEILNDKEGLCDVRERTKKLVWLLSSIEAGRAAGILPPEEEVGVKTDIHSVIKQIRGES